MISTEIVLGFFWGFHLRVECKMLTGTSSSFPITCRTLQERVRVINRAHFISLSSMIQFSLAREQGETPVLRPPFKIKGLRCDGNAESYAEDPEAVQAVRALPLLRVIRSMSSATGKMERFYWLMTTQSIANTYAGCGTNLICLLNFLFVMPINTVCQ
jgi:hypothetical protein